MANGPQRLILINAGRYNFADVELSGSLQIVGPNNTGKTTLINTLQFLYLDDRRYMEFGSYTPEQTRDYYFPNEYSYVLFEVLGVRGKCVLGWRGQSRVMGGEPERFVFEGPFDPIDFFKPDDHIRAPKEVNARLSVKQYRTIKNAQEQRELLLLATKGESRGIGLVALRDNERYPQFRETLKNLLCLSTISQDQMRDQLLMLADLPIDRYALDVRELFGDDYDRIIRLKEKLLRFKKQQRDIELLVDTSRRREELRGEVAYRWRDLLAKQRIFEQQYEQKQEALRSEAESARQRSQDLSVKLRQYRAEKEALVQNIGSISRDLGKIAEQTTEFADFMEQWSRNTLKNMEEDVRQLQRQLEDAEKETRDKAEQKLQHYRELVTQTQRAITCFDRTLITVLRHGLKEEQLASLSRLFNFDLLEQPVGENGVSLHSADQLIDILDVLSQRIQEFVYRDNNIELPLPKSHRSLDELENIERVRERLNEQEETLSRYQNILAAIEHRESLLLELNTKREQIFGKKDDHGNEVIEGITKRLFRFEEYQLLKADEPKLRAELKRIVDARAEKEDLIEETERQIEIARDEESTAKSKIESEQREFRFQARKFGECFAAVFSVEPQAPESNVPDDFSISVEQYLEVQKTLSELDHQLNGGLLRLESALGPDYTGSDEFETIRLLREELDALSEREDVLRRDWEHQLTNLQAVFDEVLKSIADLRSAADQMNRDLSNIQISNLAALRMEVQEQTDIVGSMRRLARIEQPGLFDESAGLEASVAAFRRKFESNPLLRYADLFTLQFTVTGDDGKPHHYHDFRQVESHGTTIAIKVLFNLLVLRRLLREDSQKGLLCEIPFFLDEIHSLDAVNRHAILATARKLGFIAITAAPESVSEVDALYFLQPQKGRIVLKSRHRMRVMARQRGV